MDTMMVVIAGRIFKLLKRYLLIYLVLAVIATGLLTYAMYHRDQQRFEQCVKGVA